MGETVVNVGPQNGNGQNLLIQFNFDYFKTRDGLLKIAQLVSNELSVVATSQMVSGKVVEKIHESFITLL
jgi:hypothetical protein